MSHRSNEPSFLPLEECLHVFHAAVSGKVTCFWQLVDIWTIIWSRFRYSWVSSVLVQIFIDHMLLLHVDTHCMWTHTSVMSDSVWPHRQQPTRLPRPWDSPGKNTGVGCHFLLQCMKVKSESEVAQSCPTLRDPMDCSLPGSSVYGIFQARVLEWGAIAFSAHWSWLYSK